ncbi:hypothetical protein [Okeania sp. SIO3I5]|nr:hypothetical protein [Okeania sp. SIO3I5]
MGVWGCGGVGVLDNISTHLGFMIGSVGNVGGVGRCGIGGIRGV